jgi:hypothetical protein
MMSRWRRGVDRVGLARHDARHGWSQGPGEPPSRPGGLRLRFGLGSGDRKRYSRSPVGCAIVAATARLALHRIGETAVSSSAAVDTGSAVTQSRPKRNGRRLAGPGCAIMAATARLAPLSGAAKRRRHQRASIPASPLLPQTKRPPRRTDVGSGLGRGIVSDPLAPNGNAARGSTVTCVTGRGKFAFSLSNAYGWTRQEPTCFTIQRRQRGDFA